MLCLASICYPSEKSSHLSCSKNGHIALTLPQEGQITSREVILLLCFACSQVKDTVSYPATCFQHCVDSWKVQRCLIAGNTTHINILIMYETKYIQETDT